MTRKKKTHPPEYNPTPTFESIRDELNSAGPDRGVAVVGGALVERLLLEMLLQLLIVNNNTRNFLEGATSFTLRMIAYACGIIPKNLSEDIQKIATIRNEFAHKTRVDSFELEEIKLTVRDLHSSNVAIKFSGPLPVGVTEPIETIKSFPVRVQFIYAVANVALLLEKITAESNRFPKSRWTYPTVPKVGEE